VSVKSLLEEALSNPQELLGLISQYMLEMVFLKDLEGKLLYVSPTIEKILGYTPAEYSDIYEKILLVDSNHNIAAEKTRKRYLSLNRKESDSIPAYFQEVRSKKGDIVILETHERFIVEDGERVALMGVSVDVSDYMHQLEELQGNNQGLMVIHHTQKMLMDLTGRKALLTAALEASLSMLEFDKGIVYDLDIAKMEGIQMVSRGVEDSILNKIESFPLSSQADDGTIGMDRQTTAMVFPPGHSWLAPLQSLGEEIVGLVFVFNGKADALIAVSSSVPFSRKTQRLFQAIGSLVSHSMENSYLHDTIESLSITDKLTGLKNKRYVKDFLSREDKIVSRYHKTASLLLVDLLEPLQKMTEDQESKMILSLSDMLKSCTRASDMLSRFEKQQFLLYLPETGSEGINHLINRLLLKLDDHNRYIKDNADKINIVFGRASSCEGDKDTAMLFKHASSDLAGNLVKK